jgi:hypothetical protein
VQRAKAAYNGAHIANDFLIKQGPPESQSTYNVHSGCNLGFEDLMSNTFYTTPTSNMLFGTGVVAAVPFTTSSIALDGRHTLMYSKEIVDPTGPFPIVAPNWSNLVPNNKSIRLGNALGGAEKESIKLEYTIDGALPSKIVYSYAVVLQDPGDSHAESDKPYFELKAYIEGEAPSACASFKIIAGQGKSGYSYTEGKTKLFKSWTTNVIDVAKLPGYNQSANPAQKLILEFITADCSFGAHYGYAYIDLNCEEPQIERKGPSCLGSFSTFSSTLIGNNKKEDVKWTFKHAGTPFLELSGTILTNENGEKQITSNLPNVLIPSYLESEMFSVDDEYSIEAPKVAFYNFDDYTTLEADLEVDLHDDNNPIQCSTLKSTTSFSVKNCETNIIKCKDCITSFAPIPGNKYIISAWAREDAENPLGYSKPTIGIVLNGVSKSFQFKPSGKVIDGWQKIESEFDVPEGTYSIGVELYNDDVNSSQYVYFDDIRVQPFKSSLKSFVYDAKSQKMVAELDENNYATFYQYDEEGQLVRVKKETERGVMTIKEHNTVKATRQ